MTTDLLPHPLQPIASADGSWLPRMWDLALSATDREEDGNIYALKMIAASHGYEVQYVLQETPDELQDADVSELLSAVAPPADAPVAGMLVGRTIGDEGINNWYASRSDKFSAAFPAPTPPQAAAVKTLWCVHHRGPDDVIPVASYDDAVKMADAINDRSEKFNFGHKPDCINYVYSRAYPAPWPHSPESHAAGLAPATSTGESSHG